LERHSLADKALVEEVKRARARRAKVEENMAKRRYKREDRVCFGKMGWIEGRRR